MYGVPGTNRHGPAVDREDLRFGEETAEEWSFAAGVLDDLGPDRANVLQCRF